MSPGDALRKAIGIVGSQSELARQVGVRQQAVYYWLQRDGAVPAEHCPAIERATAAAGGRVPCELLNPGVEWSVLRGTLPHAANHAGNS